MFAQRPPMTSEPSSTAALSQPLALPRPTLVGDQRAVDEVQRPHEERLAWPPSLSQAHLEGAEGP